jgi:hypothetical protein
MAIVVTPTCIQTIEFNVTTAQGSSRVMLITGKMPIDMRVDSTDIIQKESYKVLLDPRLDPGKFRKATATVSLGTLVQINNNATSSEIIWKIDDAQATLDDEANRVQLVVDISLTARGSQGVIVQAQSLMFQVTTLALI